ncbi:MAG: hypothetical protein CMN77_00985 [Spirochaetaceae bacterium]|nr:hypothetical protein [Spirochaetaceae bacterium]
MTDGSFYSLDSVDAVVKLKQNQQENNQEFESEPFFVGYNPSPAYLSDSDHRNEGTKPAAVSGQ